MFKLIAIPLTILLAAPCARAQFSIDWYSVDGGGGASSGGTFSLTGTIGQADAGHAALSPFDHDCGFWAGAGSICRADSDTNGLIEPADVAFFINRWLASLAQGTLAGDFDANGAVEPADVSLFVQVWFGALTGGGC